MTLLKLLVVKIALNLETVYSTHIHIEILSNI